jgi:hypothetical protein
MFVRSFRCRVKSGESGVGYHHYSGAGGNHAFIPAQAGIRKKLARSTFSPRQRRSTNLHDKRRIAAAAG